MATIGINHIIERAVSLREQGRVLNPSHVRGILTQIEWSTGVDDPQLAMGGIDAIIALASRLREEGHEIDDANARGIIQQIDWVVSRTIQPRQLVEPEPEPEMQIETRVIDSMKFESLCEDICAICLEMHKCGESIMTECNHTFGNQCWLRWTNTSRAKTCPTCRKNRPSIVCFVSSK